jgi:hypothetical protein
MTANIYSLLTAASVMRAESGIFPPGGFAESGEGECSSRTRCRGGHDSVVAGLENIADDSSGQYFTRILESEQLP